MSSTTRTLALTLQRTPAVFRAAQQIQRRWARVHDVRFVTTHRDQQKVLDRYKQKLEQKAKQ